MIDDFDFEGDALIQRSYSARFQREYLGNSTSIGFRVAKEILFLTEYNDIITLVARSNILFELNSTENPYNIVEQVINEIEKMKNYYGY